MKRRSFLRGSGSLALASLATGLPASFLRTGRIVKAQAGTRPSFLVLAVSSGGDPLNANCPGSYPNPSDASDVRWGIDHATVSELGSGPMGSVGGVPYGAADFAEGVPCRLGDTLTWSARPWAELPEAVRRRMSVVRHQTYTNAHPEFANVSRFHGAVKGPGRIGVESLPSFIAQETAGPLGTTLPTPISLGGPGVSFQGTPLRKQSPDTLQSLFSESGSWRGLTPTQFADFRDEAMDAIYGELRDSGTHAQRSYLDAHARSRADARDLVGALSEALAPVAATGDAVAKQVLAAVALFEHAVTPVVTIQLPFGGDNHQDSDLEVEVSEQLQGIEGIRRLFAEAEQRGLSERVTFATLSVFGRELKRNRFGGRGHHGVDHAMVMVGPGVSPGLHGQVEPHDRDFRAGAIGDVPIEETLSAAGKTLAAAVGVPNEVLEQRIVGGRVL